MKWNITISLLLLNISTFRQARPLYIQTLKMYSNIHAKVSTSHRCLTMTICQSISHRTCSSLTRSDSLCSFFLWFVDVMCKIPMIHWFGKSLFMFLFPVLLSFWLFAHLIPEYGGECLLCSQFSLRRLTGLAHLC